MFSIMSQFEYTYGVKFIVLYDSDLNNSIENGAMIYKKFRLSWYFQRNYPSDLSVYKYIKMHLATSVSD